ncbi:MAG: type II toxin-antitoxin system RelE/ParE family toxin [Burkholderiales bacterium]
MHAYKTRTFARWIKREGLADRDLRDALLEMQNGLVDARLGGGLVKKRIARAGQGKSGGYRVLVASNFGERWVFMFGFAKNERDNIDDDELKLIKRLAATFLNLSESDVRKALAAGELLEIKHGK